MNTNPDIKRPGKKRDYKNLWVLSFLLLIMGIILTFNAAYIRYIGFALLLVGGVGLIVSLRKWDSGREPDDKQGFPFE